MQSNSLQCVYLDIETWYPYPGTGGSGNLPQPDTFDLATLARRQKLRAAHPWAKDSRRCAIRFLTINVAGVIRTHDMFEGPIPQEFRDLLLRGPLVGHNLDFDLNVLLRYDCELASEVFDTMLAARLLGLGLSRENLDYLDGVDGADAFLEDSNPADNALDTVVHRYLGVAIPKEIAKLGG